MSEIEARAPQPWAPRRKRPRVERFELVLKACLVIALIVAAMMLAMLGGGL
jgi:hypothetical protein